MNYESYILSKLLDKYEGSSHYYGTSKINRRISLLFNKKEFPNYDIDNFRVKDEIHFVLAGLSRDEIIEIQWVKHEVGNIVDRVYLNIDKVEKAYKRVDRTSKEEIVDFVVAKLKILKKSIKTDWIINFVDNQLSQIIEKKSLTRYIPKDKDTFEALLNSLLGIDDKDNDEILERIFSRRYLGSSKDFEKKIRTRIATIIRDFYLKGDDLEEEEILSAVGIVKTAEELLFMGPLKINLNGEEIDFKKYIYGASMNTDMIREFVLIELPVERVITIENKASYIEYIKRSDIDKSLIVYLAGFYSPAKRVFLEKIYDFLKDKEVKFYHWGDIDFGGFKIFVQLKEEVMAKLLPMNMDERTLIENVSRCDIFDDSYAIKLEALLKDEKYACFHSVIIYMLKQRIKLEQEAI